MNVGRVGELLGGGALLDAKAMALREGATPAEGGVLGVEERGVRARSAELGAAGPLHSGARRRLGKGESRLLTSVLDRLRGESRNSEKDGGRGGGRGVGCDNADRSVYGLWVDLSRGGSRIIFLFTEEWMRGGSRGIRAEVRGRFGEGRGEGG